MVLSTDPPLPTVAGRKRPYESLRREWAREAINTVMHALPYFSAGPPLIHTGMKGEVHIDIPLMYRGYGIDRIHFDPKTREPSPKGRPINCTGIKPPTPEEIRRIIDEALKELWVVEAAEFREPEDCWIVPLAWGPFIIAHVKITRDGHEIIPDYGLTAEVKRHVY